MYIITRVIIFKGFNGTDDLHYAMLAANMLKGTYNPLATGDIFSGRVLLITWQALFYKLGSINIFTTQAPCWVALLLSCYLTVFKLLKADKTALVIVASSLFYFNPVLTHATVGILPDVYVMLAGIITLLLWNKSLAVNHKRKNIVNGAGIALIITACIFFKETAVVYPILIVAISIMHRTKAAARTCLAMLAVLIVTATASATVYYYFTGNAFFRLQQVQNSNYYNPCSYDILPASFLIIRITYGVWKLFLTDGFYPVLFAAGVICCQLLLRQRALALQSTATKYFLVLLVIGLYLPFSFTSYQPLCSDSSRHFLFLLPFAIWVCAPCLINDINTHITTKWIVICCVMLALCLLCTPDKWQWMVWAVLTLFFAFIKLLRNGFVARCKYVAFTAALWLCMPYHIFYGNSNWFANMRVLNENLTGNYYYFPEHDNMVHWQMLHGFSNYIRCYDMDATPFNVFKLYYEQLDSTHFNPGWLLVNKAYTVRSGKFAHTVDSLQNIRYFNKQLIIGDMGAYYINTPTQLAFIKNLVENDEKVLR